MAWTNNQFVKFVKECSCSEVVIFCEPGQCAGDRRVICRYNDWEEFPEKEVKDAFESAREWADIVGKTVTLVVEGFRGQVGKGRWVIREFEPQAHLKEIDLGQSVRMDAGQSKMWYQKLATPGLFTYHFTFMNFADAIDAFIRGLEAIHPTSGELMKAIQPTSTLGDWWEQSYQHHKDDAEASNPARRETIMGYILRNSMPAYVRFVGREQLVLEEPGLKITFQCRNEETDTLQRCRYGIFLETADAWSLKPYRDNEDNLIDPREKFERVLNAIWS